MVEQTEAQKTLAIMEEHVRNNEYKLLRLHMGVEKVVEISERTNTVVQEMVDDVATLRTKVAHLEDDIDDVRKEQISVGHVFRIAGMVVGATVSIGFTVWQILQ